MREERMALPHFLANDLLPPALHAATEADLHERCVADFPTSITRADVFSGLCDYRRALSTLGIQGIQWIDGSFVDRSRIDPEDIDLVNIIPYANFATIDPSNLALAGDLLAGEEATKTPYFCHTFFLLSGLPVSHSMAAYCAKMFKYWQDWFSIPQDYSDPTQKKPAPHRGKKGIVEMSL